MRACERPGNVVNTCRQPGNQSPCARPRRRNLVYALLPLRSRAAAKLATARAC